MSHLLLTDPVSPVASTVVESCVNNFNEVVVMNLNFEFPAGPWYVEQVGNLSPSTVIGCGGRGHIVSVGMSYGLAAFASMFGRGPKWKDDPEIQEHRWIAKTHVKGAAQLIAHVPQMIAFVLSEAERGNPVAASIVDSINSGKERPNQSVPLTPEEIGRCYASVEHIPR